MFDIIVEEMDGTTQANYGSYDSWQAAHEAMPDIINLHPNFAWVQIERVE